MAREVDQVEPIFARERSDHPRPARERIAESVEQQGGWLVGRALDRVPERSAG